MLARTLVQNFDKTPHRGQNILRRIQDRDNPLSIYGDLHTTRHNAAYAFPDVQLKWQSTDGEIDPHLIKCYSHALTRK